MQSEVELSAQEKLPEEKKEETEQERNNNLNRYREQWLAQLPKFERIKEQFAAAR